MYRVNFCPLKEKVSLAVRTNFEILILSAVQVPHYFITKRKLGTLMSQNTIF